MSGVDMRMPRSTGNAEDGLYSRGVGSSALGAATGHVIDGGFIGGDDDDDDNRAQRAGCCGACGVGCWYLVWRLCRGSGEDADDAVVCRRISLCTVVTVVLLTLLVTLILSSVGVSMAGGLQNVYHTQARAHAYGLASVGGGGGVEGAYARGMIKLDRARRIVSLELVVYNLPNRTSISIYGPFNGGVAPVAIPLTYEASAAPTAGGGGQAEVIRLRNPVLDEDDITPIFQRPAFFYVGLSTAALPGGAALHVLFTGEYPIAEVKIL